MRVRLGQGQYAEWNGSLMVEFYFDRDGVREMPYPMTIGGQFTTDNPPTQLQALNQIMEFVAPDQYGEYFAELGPCPACGDHVDYCQGHGPMGDPQNYAVIRLHEDGVHSMCHPLADCEA